jgi:hypothetical protein
MCKQKIIIVNHKIKNKFECFLVCMHTYKHNNKTPFMENSRAKMWQQKFTRNVKFLNNLKVKWNKNLSEIHLYYIHWLLMFVSKI